MDQSIDQSIINRSCNRLWSRHVISDTKAFSFLYLLAISYETRLTSRWMYGVCLSGLDPYARTNELINLPKNHHPPYPNPDLPREVRKTTSAYLLSVIIR